MDRRLTLDDQIAMLDSVLKGRVVLPDHPDFDALRTIVPANYDLRRPKALVRVSNVADVAAAINFAHST